MYMIRLFGHFINFQKFMNTALGKLIQAIPFKKWGSRRGLNFQDPLYDKMAFSRHRYTKQWHFPDPL